MKLMISRDAGSHYYEGARADSIEPLLARAQEMKLDQRMLRWVIESDDEQDILVFSAIHHRIANDMRAACGLEPPKEELMQRRQRLH